MTIEEIVQKAIDDKASDIHLIKGLTPRYRVNGKICEMDSTPLTIGMCEAYAKELAGVDYSQIEEIGELDMADTICGNRVRINIFRQQGAPSIALRILSDYIPKLSELGLPPMVSEFSRLNRGIVLVTGETGSGKSTTLAAILDEINHTRYDHIITLEDPIEYVYQSDKSIVNQREIGKDTRSYQDGLRAILREDPDVILIGEMRDLNTIETALTAAETGHLVFATLHTNSAMDSIDRIVSVFPEGAQSQIRLQLSTTLRAVLSQQLIPRSDGNGRVAACELMIVNDSVKNCIREGKTPQIINYMSADTGSVLMDNALIRLYKSNIISAETARAAARDPEQLKKGLF